MGSGTTGHAALMLKRRFIGVEMEPNIARDVTRERLKRAVEGYGDKAALGGGFRFCTLGEPLLDDEGQLRAGVSFWDIAHQLFFSETGRPLPGKLETEGPFIGESDNISFFLFLDAPFDSAALQNVRGDGKASGDGVKVVWARSCRLSSARLARNNIVFKQLPYEIKTR